MKPPRKHTLCTLMALLLLFSYAAAAWADGAVAVPAHRVVRVGYMPLPGFMVLDDQGEMSGYAAEYLREICKYTDWELQYVPAARHDQMNLLNQGALDLVIGQYNEERAADFCYSQLPFVVLPSLLYTRTGDPSTYNDPTDYDGKRIGVLQNSRNITLLQNFAQIMGFQFDLHTYASSTALQQALSLGEIDLLAGEQIIDQPELCAVERFSSISYYLYTTKDNLSLINEINFVLTEINAVSPDYQPRLYQQYYGSSDMQNKPYFTRHELSYIAGCDPVTVAMFPNTEPGAYLDASGKIAGILPDMLNIISSLSGIQFHCAFIPQGIKPIDYLASHPEHIVVGAMLENPALNTPEFVHSKEFYTAYAALAARKDGTYEHMSTQGEHSIGTTASFQTMHLYAQDHMPGWRLEKYITVDEGLKALVDKEIDFFTYTVEILHSRLGNPRFGDIMVVDDHFLTCHRTAVGMATPDNKQLIDIINKCLSCISPDAVNGMKELHTQNNAYHYQESDVFYRYRNVLLMALTCVVLILCLLSLGLLFHQRRYSRLVTRQTEHDQMTGLYNRVTGRVIITQYLSGNAGTPCALIMVDLDDLKGTNSTWGHSAGDEAICSIVNVLKTHLPEQTILCRIGGDEFIAFLGGVASKDALLELLEKLHEAISAQPFLEGKRQLQASIGAAMGVAGEDDLDALYHNADRALYQVKASRKNSYSIFDPQDQTLYELSTLDEVTGLPNRASTIDQIKRFLTGEGKQGHHALLMLDLDNLKKLNDTLGHQVGDEALRLLGQCLKNTFRQSDICGRIGGDEFFAFLKNISVDAILRKVKVILSSMELVYGNGSEQVSTSVSIGVALYNGATDATKTFSALYAEADAALYQSKAHGKGIYSIYNEIDLTDAETSLDKARGTATFYQYRALLDNLASGIAIYHGTLTEGLTPVMCNETLLQLLGMTYEEFFDSMSLQNMHSIHPDDFEATRQRFETAVRTRSSSRGSLRLRKHNGEYCHVLAFTNIRFFDDDSFDWYVIYSELKDSDNLRLILEGRYRELLTKRLNTAQRDESYVLLNLTKNLCLERYSPAKPADEGEGQATAEAVFAEFARDIAFDDHRAKFLNTINLAAFLQDAAQGVLTREMRIPFVHDGGNAHWYLMSTDLSINPYSGDTELFIKLSDIDNEVRLGYVIDHMLGSEYEFVAQIDVPTQSVIKLGKADDGYFGAGQRNGGKYSDIVNQGIASIIPQEYLEEATDAFSFDRILSELETKDSYTIVFPTKRDKDRGERICSWKIEYINEEKTILSMVRTNVSELLDYGYDSLTGMLDRRGFYRRAALQLNSAHAGKYWLMELDFINFKQINDNLGFAAGNRLLRLFGADLRRMVKENGRSCLVGHYEGDRFVVLLPKNSAKTPEEGYRDLVAQIESYPEAYRLPLRMGVYEITDNTLSIEQMCDCAHLALSADKNRFGKRIGYYVEGLKNRIIEEQQLLTEMQHALDTDQFEVWFQPQVDHAAGGAMIGAEALVRWRHPTRGLISPALFIPLFERNDSIYELDKYIWRRVCAYIRGWLDEGMTPPPVSINISRRDILQDDFIDTIISIVEEQRIPYHLLHLEVTESAFSDNMGKVSEAVKVLINRGFIIAIDDFGSGYSSLSMLRSVSAHIVKLDMSFFSDAENRTRNECIVESIIRMVKMLGMAVLAEGVEREEQADLLRTLGCPYVQGYLYARPLPYQDYMAYIRDTADRLAGKSAVKEVQASETPNSIELFQNIVSGTSNPLIIADRKTKQLLYANHAAEQYYGKRFDPMQFMTCIAYCGEKSHCASCPASDLQPGEKSVCISVENGKHLKYFYSQIDWNGHDAFVSHQVDITSEMQEYEFANVLIRNIPGATIAFDLADDDTPQVRYVSEQAMSVFHLAGFYVDNPSFEDCLSVIHPNDRERIGDLAKVVFRDKCSFHEEFRILLHDGNVMWLEFLMNPVADRNGRYLFYGVYADVTDRKNAQAQADAIIQNIPAAMTIYKFDGEHISRVFISQSAKHLLMTSDSQHDQISETDLYMRVHEEDRAWVKTASMEAFHLQKPFSIQFRLVGEQGQVRWVQLDSTPINSEQSDHHLFYSVYTDISAQKQLETGILEGSTPISIQDTLNYGLLESMKLKGPVESIGYILGFVGNVLQAERAYIIQKNADGTDTNTFEWVAQGVVPEKEYLQNIPGDVCAPWYAQFEKQSAVLIRDVEEIRQEYPLLYEKMTFQNIHSLIATPLIDTHGQSMGFIALDNPPLASMEHYATLVQSVAFFIEASLKRIHLEMESDC